MKAQHHEITLTDLADSSPLGKKILYTAWLAVALGLFLEALLLIILSNENTFQNIRPLVAGLVQKVSWATITCIGLVLGTVAARKRIASMGIAGLLAAPIAFIVARALHKSLLQAFALAQTTYTGPSPLLLAAIKGIEYSLLGLALGWVGKQKWGQLAAHGVVGLLVGVLFGGLFVALFYFGSQEPATVTSLIGTAINETLFPIGCSLALFGAQKLSSNS